MYKVTGKKGGIVWDTDNNHPLARFRDGLYQTEDIKTAQKLKALGYEVEGLEEKSKKKSG
jgi:hypothetical protein